MAQDQNNLVWIDMEMTGLVPDADRIIEIAMVVTDAQLNVLAEGPVLVLHQPDSVLDAMDGWNKSTHAKSGLIDKVKASSLDESGAEVLATGFLKEHVPGHGRHAMRYFGLLAPRSKASTWAAVFFVLRQQQRPHPRRLRWRWLRRKTFGVDPLLDKFGQTMYRVGRLSPVLG